MLLEDELGDIVGKARGGLGMTVAELAAATGLPEGDIRQIESYRFTPESKEMGRLCAVLHLNEPKLTAISRQEWSPKPVDPSGPLMLVRKIPVPYGQYGENAYVIACVRTHIAAVVDPGGAVDAINAVLADECLILGSVLITHAHGDHIGGIPELLAAHTGVIVASASIDRQAVMHGITVPWHPADEGSPLNVGELPVTPLATPGHTPGSTSYLCGRACFVGDTIFAGSIGKSESSEAYGPMLESIRSKLLSLPSETVLLPGHGPTTTVAQEIEHNPFF